MKLCFFPLQFPGRLENCCWLSKKHISGKVQLTFLLFKCSSFNVPPIKSWSSFVLSISSIYVSCEKLLRKRSLITTEQKHQKLFDIGCAINGFVCILVNSWLIFKILFPFWKLMNFAIKMIIGCTIAHPGHLLGTRFCRPWHSKARGGEGGSWNPCTAWSKKSRNP